MNVLILDIDSLRADHVGSFGYHGPTTPNIDQLASDGVPFHRSYVANSPCMPSRAALMSGRYGIANGIETHGPLAQQMRRPEHQSDWAGSWTENEPERPWWTLPELLFQHRYRTVGISSFPRHPAPWFYHVWHEFHQPQEPEEEMAVEWGHVRFQTPRASAVTDLAIEVLDRNSEEPVFAYVQYWDPHAPYNRSEAEIDQFRDVELPPYPTAEDIEAHREWDTLRGATQEGITDRDALNEMVSAYDAEINYVDEHVGRLLAYLKRTEQYHDTLIILTGDHGEEFGEHGLYREHWSTHDGTQRVPTIIKPPSTYSVEVEPREALITNVDIAPTIADYLDLNPPERWQGRSLRPIIESTEAPSRDEIVFDHGLYTAQRAIRTDRWKLIHTRHPGMWAGELPEWQLFEMESDPYEQENVATAHQHVVQELQDEMRTWVHAHTRDDFDGLDPVVKRGPSGYNSFKSQFQGI